MAYKVMASKNGRIDLIITRNKKDFKNDWVEIQTPGEYFEGIR